MYRAFHLLIPFFVCFTGQALFAADFYVSTSGDDANAGSEAMPWKTIQKAANSLTPGDRVLIRDGSYKERVTINVSGSSGGGRVEFLNYPDELPVIDGTGFTPTANGDDALITIRDQNYLTISGLEIRNYRTAVKNRVPIGIFITGNSDFVSILDNKIHHIETNFRGEDGGDAHGIAVFGDEVDPLDSVVIEGNELSDLKLGSSEALVLNGNVTNFLVAHNVVHDCNNIAIDFIGFENVGPNAGVDQARDGVCRGNRVYNIDSRFNPAYGGHVSRGGGDQSAGGIYVDGGTRILVEQNVVHHCNIGIELASEHSGRSTSEITVRNNLVYQNHIGGIFMGGYDTRRGSTRLCEVLNNTLYLNDSNKDGNGEIYLQFDVRNCVIKNNILVANSQQLLIGNPYTQNSGNVVDYNLFRVANGGSGEWQWRKNFYGSFAAYKSGSSNDANSVSVDPQFTDPSQLNWHPMSGSPARNAGDPGHPTGAGEKDFDERERVEEGRVDMGCFEFQTTAADVQIQFRGNGMVIVDGDDTPDLADNTDFGGVDWTRGKLVAKFEIENTGADSYRILGNGSDAPFVSQSQLARVGSGETRCVWIEFDPGAVETIQGEAFFAGLPSTGFALAGEGILPPFQPDHQIGRSPGGLHGDLIYNLSGGGQTVSDTVKGGSRTFHLVMQNDGSNPDVSTIRGTRKNRYFKVRYFRIDLSGRRQVTGTVTRGTEMLSLAAAEGKRYQLKVGASRQARERRKRRTFSITGISQNDSTRVDRVRAKARAR